MKEELLIEHWGMPGEMIDDKLMVEAIDDKEKGALYIEGIFMQANIKNRNGRIYPRSVLEAAVNKYIAEQINTRQSLGENNHPPRAMPDPTQASLIIEKLWWEGDNVMGRARIIEGDYGPGDKLAANIRAGWIPGVSSRGLGSVKNGLVQEGFRLTVGVDAVWGPSAPDAYVKPLRESTESTSTEKDVINNSVNETNQSADDAFKLLMARLSSI